MSIWGYFMAEILEMPMIHDYVANASRIQSGESSLIRHLILAPLIRTLG